MDARIDRYLDGDLSEAEAMAFRRDLATDPALEAELRSWERALAAYVEAWPAGPGAGFGDRVIAAIATEDAPAARAAAPRGKMTGAVGGSLVRQDRSRSRGRAVPTWLAAAAALVACFGLGLEASRLLPGFGTAPHAGGPDAPRLAGEGSLAAATATEPSRGGALVPVRLVFVPGEAAVSSVAVAGSFNGWDPAATPMERHDGVWTAVLLLPAGSHEYMFVLDGREWRTDPLALTKRDDGFGRENAVIDLAL